MKDLLPLLHLTEFKLHPNCTIQAYLHIFLYLIEYYTPLYHFIYFFQFHFLPFNTLCLIELSHLKALEWRFSASKGRRVAARPEPAARPDTGPHRSDLQ